MRRTFLVKEGTKRVEDPTAIHHPCDTCGNMLTISLYEVIDGYLFPKDTPFPENVKNEHKIGCEYAARYSFDHKILDVCVVKYSDNSIQIISSPQGSLFPIYAITLDANIAEQVGVELIRVSDKK